MAANSNTGISAEQAAQVLLAAGFKLQFCPSQKGNICLHNDADIAYFISEEHIALSQYYGPFNANSLHELAQCSIGQGGLILGPAISIEIEAYELAPNAKLCIKRG